ncbi:MAG: phosphatidate cytidylyltransferase [Chloroflexota bacterium]
MLKERILTSLWGLPLVTIVNWFDRPFHWFTVVAVIWTVLAVREFYRLADVHRTPLAYFGLTGAVLLMLSPYRTNLLPFILTATLVLSLAWLLRHNPREGAFNSWVWMISGMLCLGWLLSYFVSLRIGDAGRNWVYLAMFGTFGCDTLAYFIGTPWGRHKLAPRISPGKTWEGAVAGVLGSVVVSLIFVLPTPLQLPLSYGQAILLGLLVSVLGQLGGLVVSLFKRNRGVKDSGNLLPGHGGMLDRTDSLLFAGATVYYFALALRAGWLNWL